MPALPGTAKWPPKPSHLLGVCGATALVLGLIFVIAFNWAGLGKFPKFALVQGLIIVLVVAAVMRGLNTRLGKGLLIMALGCIGPLLAVFGQTYQTGADVWQLFVAWAALGVVWAIAARSGAACLVWVIIAQTALWLYLDTFYDLSRFNVGGLPLWLLVLAINGGLLVIWEFAATRFPWLSGRLAPRLIAAVLLFAMTSAAIHSIFWDRAGMHLQAFLGWIILMGAGFFWYGRGKRDIVIVTLAWVSLAAVALALVIKLLLRIDPILTVFLCFFIALGVLGLGISWLRKNFTGATHWIVDLAAAFGAWIAMLLLVLLIGLMVGGFVADLPPFWFVMSLITGIAAIALAKASTSDQVFRKQMVNVLALAAPTLAYVAVFMQRGGNYEYKSLMAVYLASAVALALWCLLPSKQARALMSIIVVYGIIAALHHLGLGALAVWILFAAACAIWLLAPNSFLTDQLAIHTAADNIKIQRLTEFGYATSLWTLLLGVGLRSHDHWGLWYAFWRSRGDRSGTPDWASIPWLPSALAFLIVVLVATILIKKARGHAEPLMLTLGLASAALSAWYAPYLLVCAIFFALGVSTERRKLMVLASFGIVAALFEYYFELATPLWMKGCVLAALGILLLALAWRFSRFNAPPHTPASGVQS